jgi:hypothetical protein
MMFSCFVLIISYHNFCIISSYVYKLHCTKHTHIVHRLYTLKIYIYLLTLTHIIYTRCFILLLKAFTHKLLIIHNILLSYYTDITYRTFPSINTQNFLVSMMLKPTDFILFIPRPHICTITLTRIFLGHYIETLLRLFVELAEKILYNFNFPIR